MMTPVEMKKIVDQVNAAFEKANARITELEARVAELEAKKQPGRPAKAA